MTKRRRATQLPEKYWKTKKENAKPLPLQPAWLSEHDWEPLLDTDYSWLFQENFQKYSHYLDTITQRGELSNSLRARSNNE